MCGYCKTGDASTAILLYKDGMCRKNLIAETSIRSVWEKGRIAEALYVLNSAEQKVLGLPLQLKSYEALIRGLCEQGKMDEGLKLQAEMVGRGFRPNHEVYFAFINGYVNQGNEDMAEKLKKEMLEILS